MDQLRFYSAGRFAEPGEPFFSLPQEAPAFEVIESRPYRGGVLEVLRYPSRYQVRNPALADAFAVHPANRHDLHSSVLLLHDRDYRRIGLIGASLGGYTGTLYASRPAAIGSTSAETKEAGPGMPGWKRWAIGKANEAPVLIAPRLCGRRARQ